MRGFFWFLLVSVIFIAFGLQSAQAECLYDAANPQTWSSHAANYLVGNTHYLGESDNRVSDVINYCGGSGSAVYNGSFYPTGVDYIGALYYVYIRDCNGERVWARSSYGAEWVDSPDVCDSSLDPPGPPDADGDGLPDSCDFYPSDPNPYDVRQLSYQESGGVRVRVCYETDRGDVYCLGNPHDDSLVDNVTIGSDWIHASEICSTGDETYGGSASDGETDIAPDSWTDDDGTPSGVGMDDQMQDGVEADGTDPADLQKIIDNTAATADNVSRLSDYLKDQNSDLHLANYYSAKMVDSLGNVDGDLDSVKDYLISVNTGLGNLDTDFGTMDSSLTNMEGSLDNVDGDLDDVKGSLSNIDGDLDDIKDLLDDGGGGDVDLSNIEDMLGDISNPDTSNVSSAVGTVGSVDQAYQDAQNGISSDVTLDQDAPEGYQEKRDISAVITDYISNNPLADIIENSGVQISGATPTADFDYNGHMISLSVSGFDAQLEAFGQILLGITTLAGMLLIFRGF
jgi:hypothetical protein